jgi:hypothetical protein
MYTTTDFVARATTRLGLSNWGIGDYILLSVTSLPCMSMSILAITTVTSIQHYSLSLFLRKVHQFSHDI